MTYSIHIQQLANPESSNLSFFVLVILYW